MTSKRAHWVPCAHAAELPLLCSVALVSEAGKPGTEDWHEAISGLERLLLSLSPQWPSMPAFLQATADTSAAPRPLPSSDAMKVISQLGVNLRTLAWKRSLKLQRRKARLAGCTGARVCTAPAATHCPAKPGPAGAPGVQLVHGAVHAHGDAHDILAAALPHAVDDACQPRSAHVRGARGHALASAPHQVAVGHRRPQSQGAQDVEGLLAVARVAAGGTKTCGMVRGTWRGPRARWEGGKPAQVFGTPLPLPSLCSPALGQDPNR